MGGSSTFPPIRKSAYGWGTRTLVAAQREGSIESGKALQFDGPAELFEFGLDGGEG